jgi:Branched-chain amino acid transport protein (AzlD)
MSAVWVLIISLAVATAAMKLVGPLLLGGRVLPAGAMNIIGLLAAALLAALVVVETFGKGRSLTLDARALGVTFAAIALARRSSMTVAIIGAALVTAIARALA